MCAQVSVVMAVKNESTYIEEAVHSILSQTGVDLEVIVVDDSSSDDTSEKVKRIAAVDHRLKLIENRGVGKVAAFNLGVATVQGQFVCLFAGDDIMPLGSLRQRYLSVAKAHDNPPTVGLSKIETLSSVPRLNGVIVPRQKGVGNPSGQSPMMNREALRLLFPIPESLPNEDTWLEIALCHTALCEVTHSDVICCQWRIHDGNSYNYSLPHADFKAKILKRRQAYALFFDHYKAELSADEKSNLEHLIELGRAYESTSYTKLFFCKAPLKEKLRLLASMSPGFYSLRGTLYSLFSGW